MATKDKKIIALAKHLEITPDKIEKTAWKTYRRTDDVRGEYKVYTDREATKAATEEVRRHLWAFNTDFIMRHCPAFDELSDRETEQVEKGLREMQGNLCETANEIVFALIGGNRGFRRFAEDAIDADGRGHHLAGYDGNEEELEGTPYYLYCEDR